MKNLNMKQPMMSRKISFVVLITLLVTVSAFAQYDFDQDIKIPVFKSVNYYAAVLTGEEEYSIPHGIANNQFYLQSLHFSRLAHEQFENAEYGLSAVSAQEAIRYASLSDQYVSEQLIPEAKRWLDWADDYDISSYFPQDYTDSKDYYEASVLAFSNEDWSEAIDFAVHSIEILFGIEIPAIVEVITPQTPDSVPSTTVTPPVIENRPVPLPSQYTVRPWVTFGDSLSTIAGYSFVYGDEYKWQILYEANRSRMPQPNNPHLIDIGFVINIPSIDGEVREGMWDPNVDYSNSR